MRLKFTHELSKNSIINKYWLHSSKKRIIKHAQESVTCVPSERTTTLMGNVPQNLTYSNRWHQYLNSLYSWNRWSIAADQVFPLKIDKPQPNTQIKYRVLNPINLLTKVNTRTAKFSDSKKRDTLLQLKIQHRMSYHYSGHYACLTLINEITKWFQDNGKN